MGKCDTMDSQMHLIGNATSPLYTDPVFESHTIIGDARSHTNHDTVNDKSFEGEKFCGLMGPSGMRGKVSQFCPSPPS